MACQQAPDHQSSTASGTVKSIAADRHTVEIAHEEIPGFMSAMTMAFAVKDPAVLWGIAPGDEVTFALEQTPESLSIMAIGQGMDH